jgi:hypothetical protein
LTATDILKIKGMTQASKRLLHRSKQPPFYLLSA